MNNWGAVKLGLAVATAGTLGVFGSRRPAGLGSFRAKSQFANAAPQLQSMVSGAAASLDQAAEGQSFGGEAKASAGGLAVGGKLERALKDGRTRAGLQPQGAVRKVVRSASLCFEVKDHSKARALVRGVVLRHGAEIFSEDGAGSGDNESGTIVIQAPPEQLDAILKDLEPLGRVVARSISSQNMSEEYVDLKSRLENYKKVEARLTELMAFKTSKLADVLELERELERVGQQIEETVGRMKYIDTLAASSRITVRLAQPAVVAAQQPQQAPGILAQARNSLVGAFNTFVNTGLSLLSLTCFVLAIAAWTLPVTGVLWLAWRRLSPSVD